MKVIYDYPPNYDEIAEAFDLSSIKGIVFTYGEDLYVPEGKSVILDKPLIRHEMTHTMQQQAMGIEAWWKRYLVDPKFRLEQELEAYRVQYKALASLPPKHQIGYLNHISQALAGDMYGNILSVEQAKAIITEGITLRSSMPGKPNSDSRRRKKRERQNRKKARK